MSGETLALLAQGIHGVTVPSLVMMAVALALLYLGIARNSEPLLLVPIGAGCLLANLPLSPLVGEHGMLRQLYDMGVGNELFPLRIFIGIGALTDFGPLLENPRMVLLGAAGQFGIFMTLLLALAFGFSREEAASIGIIGAIDGPTSIYVSGILAPHQHRRQHRERGRGRRHGAPVGVGLLAGHLHLQVRLADLSPRRTSRARTSTWPTTRGETKSWGSSGARAPTTPTTGSWATPSAPTRSRWVRPRSTLPGHA